MHHVLWLDMSKGLIAFLVICRCVVALKRMGIMDHFNWQLGVPILFAPKYTAESLGTAFYSPGTSHRNLIACDVLEQDLEDIDSFKSAALWFDAIAHEAGHGVMHSLCPTAHYCDDKQVAAFREAFGDITVILTQISQLDICEKAIVAAKGDLHTKTFFTKTCEQLGEVRYGSDCIRNVDNDLAIDEVTEEKHDLSQVFTGAFYDILVDIYDDKTDLSMFNPAMVLYQTGEHMMELLIKTVLDLPAEPLSLADMARRMMEAEKNDKYKEFMQKHFDRRKLFDPSAKPKPVPAEGEMSSTAKERRVQCGDRVELKMTDPAEQA